MSARLAPPPIEDAPCVAVYRDLRAGVPRHSAQIGHGYNLYPTTPEVHRFLQRALAHCAAGGRLHEYGTDADGHDRALAATLAGAYLGLDLDADQIAFTAGATEGIGLVARFLASCDAGLLLPAPCYYAFEQTPRRWGGTIVGRYRADGTVHPTGAAATHTALVEIFPNGVTGTLFRPPATAPDFRVVDVVFLAGGRGPDLVADQVRAAVADGIADTAVLMTPSKDLCIPGIRPGLLISGHAPLVAAVRDDVLDRIASSSPLSGQLVLLYLAVLLIAQEVRAGRRGNVTARYRWLRQQYLRHHVPTMPALNDLQVIAAHLDAMADHFTTAFDLLHYHATDLLGLGDQPPPVAGYSLLAAVTRGPELAEDVIRWVNTVGQRHCLKLNPSYLFGGTAASWQALYPGPARIRVNLSVPHRDLLTTLDLLRHARQDLLTLDQLGAQ
ncbi:hypothetical protein ACEZDB_32475 [Streptacidiphilus sp. N1-3]|uniref:Uncharacterized protein n=1 Tax=Streptacidiphilus alkalitolerans TaxID=3342712 RepID=A0ABV6XBI3_9ACTN